MRTTLALLAPILSILFCFPSQQSPAEPPTVAPQTAQAVAEMSEEARQQEKEAIKHVLVSQLEAWNRGNIEAFMNGYWRSDDLTFYSGATITKGWQPTLAHYKKRYQGQGREMGKLEFQNIDIDLLGRRGAVVTGAFQLTMSDGKKPHGIFTLVFKRFPNGWKIVHDHTSAAE